MPIDPNPCHRPALHLACPDWVMSAPTDLHLRGMRFNRAVLEMTNSLVNVGAGPVELKGRRSSERDMYARQVIRSADGGPAMVVRTGARLHFTYVDARRGSYWKVSHAARFELWRLDASGRRTERVRVGPKLDYCNRDLARRRPNLPGSPPSPVFPACSQNPRIGAGHAGHLGRLGRQLPPTPIRTTGSR